MSHSKPIPNPLTALETSLQMEFEYFAQYDWSADILAAKKRQLQMIKELYKPIAIEVRLAKRADKPQIPWAKLMRLKSTLPSVKEIINQIK